MCTVQRNCTTHCTYTLYYTVLYYTLLYASGKKGLIVYKVATYFLQTKPTRITHKEAIADLSNNMYNYNKLLGHFEYFKNFCTHCIYR